MKRCVRQEEPSSVHFADILRSGKRCGAFTARDFVPIGQNRHLQDRDVMSLCVAAMRGRDARQKSLPAEVHQDSPSAWSFPLNLARLVAELPRASVRARKPEQTAAFGERARRLGRQQRGAQLPPLAVLQQCELRGSRAPTERSCDEPSRPRRPAPARSGNWLRICRRDPEDPHR
jgi:hypothetical protein